MIYRLGDVLPEIAPYVGGGGVDLCEGRDEAVAAINRAIRQLLDEGDWAGAEAEICLEVDGCCVTLDERFLGIKLMRVRNGPALRIHGQNFKYVDSGPGELTCCGSVVGAIADLGDGFAVHKDPPKAMHVTAFSDRAESDGACLEIRGTDQRRKEVLKRIPIRHSHGQDGKPPAYTAPDADWWTDGKFVSIQELRKSKTCGYVYIWAYDPATGEMCWLTTLRPDTTSPCHRRYLIPNSGANGAFCASEVIAKVSFRYYPVCRDEDVLIIQNPEAIKSMIQAHASKDAKDSQNYMFYKNSAISQLKKQVGKRDRGTQNMMQLRFGGSPLRGGRYTSRPGCITGHGRGGATGPRNVIETRIIPCGEPIPGPAGKDGQHGKTGAAGKDGADGTCTTQAERVLVGEFIAHEDMGGGRFVQFFESGGETRIRYADASLSRHAQGFIIQAVSAGASVAVYNEGDMPNLAGIVPGQTYFLSSIGQRSTTQPGAGISQIVGFGETTSNLTVSLHIPITI